MYYTITSDQFSDRVCIKHRICYLFITRRHLDMAILFVTSGSSKIPFCCNSAIHHIRDTLTTWNLESIGIGAVSLSWKTHLVLLPNRQGLDGDFIFNFQTKFSWLNICFFLASSLVNRSDIWKKIFIWKFYIYIQNYYFSLWIWDN